MISFLGYLLIATFSVVFAEIEFIFPKMIVSEILKVIQYMQIGFLKKQKKKKNANWEPSLNYVSLPHLNKVRTPLHFGNVLVF